MENDIVESSSASRIGYFISGAVIGSCIALLYAPRAGRETRDRMSDWFQEKKERGQAAVKDAVDSGSRTFRRVRREAGV